MATEKLPAKGTILVGTGTKHGVTGLPPGMSGQTLTADPTEPTGLKYVAPLGASATSGDISQIDVGDAASAGILATAAKADHQHALPAPGLPVAVSGTTPGAGSASTVARSDHQHAYDSTRALDSAVVHNTGTETVDGAKTFTSSPVIKSDATTAPAQLELWDTKSGQATPKKFLRSVNGKFEVVNNAYNAVIMSLSDAGKLWLPTNVAHEMGSLEIGQRGVGNTPYVDFHSGATDVDFDARIIASGGTGTSGRGTIKIEAGKVELAPNDATDEGGQLDLLGAGGYGTVSVDNFQGNFRILTPNGAPYVNASNGESFSKRNNRLTEAVVGGPLIQSGSVTITFSASATGTGTITFSPAFATAPKVVATIAGGTGSTHGSLNLGSGATTSQCVVTCISHDGNGTATSITSTWTVNWIAIGS